MTVGELIKVLEALPKDYQVIYESGDAYGSAYYVYVDDVRVNIKTKEVELIQI